MYKKSGETINHLLLHREIANALLEYYIQLCLADLDYARRVVTFLHVFKMRQCGSGSVLPNVVSLEGKKVKVLKIMREDNGRTKYFFFFQ
jgi:hypothetical protein